MNRLFQIIRAISRAIGWSRHADRARENQTDPQQFAGHRRARRNGVHRGSGEPQPACGTIFADRGEAATAAPRFILLIELY